MERTEIIKALEHWSKNFDGKVTDFATLCKSISLINELTEEVERLEKAKYVFATVDYCADDLANALKENKRLTAENEKLTINMNAYGLTTKRLAEEKEELTIELNAMRTAANSYKMHYEKLEAENERLRADKKELINDNAELKNQLQEEIAEEDVDLSDELLKLHIEGIEEAKAYTVRKMQSEIKRRCIEGGIYPAIVKSTIDQVAKEMLDDKD